MNELSPRARALIDSASCSESPSDSDKRRLKAAILAQVGIAASAGTASAAVAAKSGVAATGNSAAAAAGTTTAAGSFALSGKAIVALAAMALGAGGIAATGLVSSEKPHASQSITATVPASRATPAPVPAPDENRLVAADSMDDETSAEAAEPELEFPPQRVRAPAKKKPEVAPEKTEAPAPLDSIRAEHALIRQARAARARGDSEATLTILKQHKREFPQGRLIQEREALYIFLLCDRGLRDLAEPRVQSFEGKWPRSPLLKRIRSACKDATSSTPRLPNGEVRDLGQAF